MSRLNRHPRPSRPAVSAFFLVGVTACGKTAVAQLIAEREGYDLLSADSMLVYRGMDVGTAKPSRDKRSRVNYHGIDLVDPDRPFSVWEFREYAVGVLEANSAAGRKTIVVGGSGLYVKSLTAGLRKIPGANDSARGRWEDVYGRDGIVALQAALKERHGGVYATLSDKSNPRRLIRALELAESGVNHLDSTWSEPQTVLMAGLRMPRVALAARIRERVLGMYESGFEREVAELLRRCGALSDSARQAIGYAEALDLIAGRCTREDAVEKTAARTRRLAKRQQTWFNHQANVGWIECGAEASTETTADLVAAHWARHGPVPIAV